MQGHQSFPNNNTERFSTESQLAIRCGMVLGLERRQTSGDLHFVTFSCWHRLGHLGEAPAREVFERSLAHTAASHRFDVVGYVLMPEHVHLLVTEPAGELLSVA